ncbi:hypothetical protein JKA74_06505 [Marivirga sp. S37H4]|uniref:Uncharacterized protein n=1 Tax=Marivirga aurantiaca TaxID=2802615 RepID=A0A934WXE6_9BACT|nr:hypothetical protein [Marivirga aurantiaca]MBK6264681.1 hypothetical protein [Marivirga aurantiaca]
MHLYKNNIALLFSFIAMACQPNTLQIEILETKVLDGVPSASGMAISGMDIYLIGDDSPFLFQLDDNFNIVSKTTIFSIENLSDEQIPKPLKPDFEAMEMVNEDEIILFGSGSKSPERDYFVRVLLGKTLSIKKYQISAFYHYLKGIQEVHNNELNIEAVALVDQELLLFNRSGNLIFLFNYDNFLRAIQNEIPFPKPQIIKMDLPAIKGIEAGVSGATITNNSTHLILSASVEDTDNAYDDGAILGSFIGIVDIASIDDQNAWRWTLIGATNKFIKVESVSVFNQISANEAELLLVTDSDGGESLLLRGRLKW